jgi:HPt (histidine-containing phosphotransfer) domain-containing protein
MTMSSVPWVLPEELRQLAESDEDLVNEVLAVFQSDTTDRIRKLRAALDSGDRQQVRHQAHAVKGSAGQVGAAGVSELCRQLELQALTAETPVLLDLTARLEAAFADVCRAMSA